MKLTVTLFGNFQQLLPGVPTVVSIDLRFAFWLMFSVVMEYTIQVNGTVRAKSGGCWPRLAGGGSIQGPFCTKSPMHGVLVIKGNTRTVNGGFYCTLISSK